MFVKDMSDMPDKKLGMSQAYTLERWKASAAGAVEVHPVFRLEASHIVAWAKDRRRGTDARPGVSPATVGADLTTLRGPLTYAALGFGMPEVSAKPITDAMAHLIKYNLVGKSRPRNRRPTGDEYKRLMDYFAEQDKRSDIPMAVLVEFAVFSARRISEICRLRWGDVNGADMTCIVRDMKDPKQKKGNDHEFPLLGRAWDIVMAQPRRSDDPGERIFPYNAKSAGQRYTRAKHALGIENLRFHDLRREAASRLFEQGYGVPEVMVVTGHKTPQLLMRVYTKLKPADLHKGPAANLAKNNQPQPQPEQRNA